MKRIFLAIFAVIFLFGVLRITSQETVHASGQDSHQSGITRDNDGPKRKMKPHRNTSELNPYTEVTAGTNSSTNSITGISYKGGPLIGTPTVYYIWYGNWDQNNGSDNPQAKQLLENLAMNIGESPYFNINIGYSTNGYGISGDVVFGGSITDSYSQGSSITSSSVQTIVTSAINNGSLPYNADGIYFVLTSSDVSETSGFCTEYCGWHNKMTPTVGKVRFSFVGNPAKCINSCAAQSTGPNGNAGADAMASVIVHELEETVTDPDLNAWFDSSGSENADKCAWTFGTTYTASNGSSYNVTLGGVNYLLQRNWDARIGACAMDSSITEILVSAPTSLTFNARFGGANPTSQILNITDSKNNIVNWSANENTGWLKVSSATGSTPGSTTVSVDISGLAAGTYNSTINLSAAGVTQIAVPVKLKISSETITASPSSLSFVAKVGGANPSNQTLSITGSSTLAWVASENNSWLSLNSTSGNTPGSTSVSVNISGMAVGTYNATITVTSDAASSPLNVPVTLRIYNDSLSSGQNLLPDQFLTSQNGQYRLIMQADGNLVVYNSSSQPLWSSNTGGQAVRECLMQADGNLVIYKTNGQALWSSNTGGNTRSSLQLQDDGYVAIKNSASTLIWGTWDTLFHDQQLIPGQILYSQNRQYRLVMQGDGNLVMYNSSNQPLWASNTGGQSIKNCLMNADGNLIIYKTTGQVSWASNTGDKGKSRLVIQNDGNLVIYTLNPQYPTWDRFHGRL